MVTETHSRSCTIPKIYRTKNAAPKQLNCQSIVFASYESPHRQWVSEPASQPFCDVETITSAMRGRRNPQHSWGHPVSPSVRWSILPTLSGQKVVRSILQIGFVATWKQHVAIRKGWEAPTTISARSEAWRMYLTPKVILSTSWSWCCSRWWCSLLGRSPRRSHEMTCVMGWFWVG